MKQTISLNSEQERILEVIAKRTKRTIEELITNYLTGWIGTLQPEAKKELLDIEINKLSYEEKQQALNLLQDKQKKGEKEMVYNEQIRRKNSFD